MITSREDKFWRYGLWKVKLIPFLLVGVGGCSLSRSAVCYIRGHTLFVQTRVYEFVKFWHGTVIYCCIRWFCGCDIVHLCPARAAVLDECYRNSFRDSLCGWLPGWLDRCPVSSSRLCVRTRVLQRMVAGNSSKTHSVKGLIIQPPRLPTNSR